MPAHVPLVFNEAVVLGCNVERLRKQAGMDVATFARVSGLSRPTIYKVERGESNLKLSYIKKMADALDVSVAELLTFPAEKPGRFS